MINFGSVFSGICSIGKNYISELGTAPVGAALKGLGTAGVIAFAGKKALESKRVQAAKTFTENNPREAATYTALAALSFYTVFSMTNPRYVALGAFTAGQLSPDVYMAAKSCASAVCGKVQEAITSIKALVFNPSSTE